MPQNQEQTPFLLSEKVRIYHNLMRNNGYTKSALMWYLEAEKIALALEHKLSYNEEVELHNLWTKLHGIKLPPAITESAIFSVLKEVLTSQTLMDALKTKPSSEKSTQEQPTKVAILIT